MAKSQQVIFIQPPNELVFKGPFDEIVSSRLTLLNPTTDRVCFKVKTTAPRRYCVRPNSGIIEPNSNVGVMLMLQPFEFDPNEKNKHKFMVQTMVAPEGEVNLDVLFKEALPNQLMDSKLRCVFEMPPKEGETTESQITEDTANVQLTGASSEVPPRTPPKTSAASDKSSDEQLKKAAEEVKNLRSENSSLRQDLLSLKEEALRLRNSAKAGGAGVPGKIAGTSIVFPSDRDQSLIYTSTHIAIAFAIAFVSFILGKWIL